MNLTLPRLNAMTNETQAMPEPAIVRRAAFAKWLDRRDTTLIELLLGAACFIVSFMIWETSALDMSSPLQGHWFHAFIVLGAIKLLALSYGLWTGNTYRLRGAASFVASIVWSLAAIQVHYSSALQWITALFGLFCILSWVAFVVLMVRADLRYSAAARVQ